MPNYIPGEPYGETQKTFRPGDYLRVDAPAEVNHPLQGEIVLLPRKRPDDGLDLARTANSFGVEHPVKGFYQVWAAFLEEVDLLETLRAVEGERDTWRRRHHEQVDATTQQAELVQAWAANAQKWQNRAKRRAEKLDWARHELANVQNEYAKLLRQPREDLTDAAALSVKQEKRIQDQNAALRSSAEAIVDFEKKIQQRDRAIDIQEAHVTELLRKVTALESALQGSEASRLAGEQKLAQTQALLNQQQETVSVLSQQRAELNQIIAELPTYLLPRSRASEGVVADAKRLREEHDRLEFELSQAVWGTNSFRAEVVNANQPSEENYRREFTPPIPLDQPGSVRFLSKDEFERKLSEPGDTGLLRALRVDELLALKAQDVIHRQELRAALGLSDDRPQVEGVK